jgi:hypothetical protein
MSGKPGDDEAGDSGCKAAARKEPPSWREIVWGKWATVALSGLLLASLNHCYWNEQESVKRRDLYLQQKIKVYSDASSTLTRLIGLLNDEVYEKGRRRSGAALDRRLRELDDRIVQTQAEISAALAGIGVYFGDDVRAKARELRKVMSGFDRDKNAAELDSNSPLVVHSLELIRLIQEEVRKEFKGASQVK